MNLKTSLLLALVCSAVSPSSLYAAPKAAPAKKAAKPQVEYCLVTYTDDGNSARVFYADHSTKEQNVTNPVAILARLARTGWRVITSSETNYGRSWTLERRK